MRDEFKIVKFSTGYYGVQTGKNFVSRSLHQWYFVKDVEAYCQMSLRQARKVKKRLSMEVVAVLDE